MTAMVGPFVVSRARGHFLHCERAEVLNRALAWLLPRPHPPPLRGDSRSLSGRWRRHPQPELRSPLEHARPPEHVPAVVG